MHQNDDGSTHPGPDDDLDAGLRAAFAGTPRRTGDDDGNDSPESVVNLLNLTLGFSARLSLREPEGEYSPIVRARGSSDGSAPLPERVGRYRISGEIATGGVGSVFRAHDVDLGRDVAFKVLRDRHAGNADMIRRFLEEAQIGGQLQHPGIVSVHEMGLLAAERPYFTMKLVKGRTLASLLRERKDPAEERQRFLGIFEQICQPIAYAHARGVIHRDLKPSNVMVGAFGEVQVMDWGLAKILARGGAEDDRRATKTPQETVIRTLRSGEGSSSLAGSVLGTPAYMPPEQARGDVDDLDECSDVFGLGAILCEVLTGDPPYRGESVEEVHRQARKGDLADAHARIEASGADEEIVGLARRCLAFEPGGRPRNGGAVAREVREYINSLDARAREERARAARARMRTVVVAAVMVVLAAVGLSGLWLEMERRDARSETALQAQKLMAKAKEHLASAGSDPAAMLGEAASARELFLTAATLIDRDALPGLASDLDDLGASVDRSIRRAKFLVQLEQIRDGESSGDRAYDEAFTELLGGRIFDLSPPSIAERIRQAGIEPEAALALDDWALVRRQSGNEWRSLVETSIMVERSAARVRLWDLVESGSPEGLVDLLAQLDGVTAAQWSVAGSWAEGEGHTGIAEALYRRTLELEPDSFRAHFGLGVLLTRGQRITQSLPHLVAARALNPDCGWVLAHLAQVYAETGDAGGAIRTCQSILSRNPTGSMQTWPCEEILQRADLSFSSADLDALIVKALELARTEERFSPSWWLVLGAALVHRYCPGEAERAIEIARGEVERTHGRDPWILMMLSRVESASGRKDDAVRTLEEADASSTTLPEWRRRIRECRRAVRPRIISYASIDAAIDEPPYLVEEGDPWRYFKGTRLPSPGDEWTRPEFDDGNWLEGPTGIGYGDGDDATVLGDMRWSYADVYARRSLTIPDPTRHSRIVLSVDADDGFAAWLNGELAGAARMDPKSGRVTEQFDAGKQVEIELTGKVRAGRNVIAIRVGNFRVDSTDLSLIPEVWAARVADPDTAAARFDSVRAGLEWDASGALEAYLDGRLALGRGEHRRAAERFRRVIELDRSAIEPFERLREAVAKSDGDEAAENALRAEVAKGAPVAILNTPPAQPEGLRAEKDGLDLIFSALPFRHVDARVEHAWTRWQVRTASADYDRTPAVDVLSAERLTRFALPRHALAPRTRYLWRVIHYAANGASATSAEATLTTGEYSFEAIRFDLAAHFNRDVVANPGDDANDYADSGTGRFIVDGFDGQDARPEAMGLPKDRTVGLHRLADYDGPNALQFGPRTLLPIRIHTPGGNFSALRVLVAGANTGSIVPLSLEYSDDGVERVSLRVEDWFDDPEPELSTSNHNGWPVRDGGVPIRNGMNRQDRNFDSRKDPALFEMTVPLDPERELRALVIEPARIVAVDPYAIVNVFSIVGVRAGKP
jgi:tetratricopeptide (TPR) repeat protein